MLSCYFAGRESDHRRMLDQDGQVILIQALSSLQSTVAFLKNGTIEFQMLFLIRDHSERFLLLCKLISKEGSEQSSLKQLLDQRCIEITAFQEERDKVSSFIRMCSLIKQGNRSYAVVNFHLPSGSKEYRGFEQEPLKKTLFSLPSSTTVKSLLSSASLFL